ncbi:MAG: hypothetical protein ACJAZP_003664 [Psychromonas sp.]|uniref:YnbE family lipoprotein n=1 Tax=Psychromonas sp. TaxID=1884585 RepID=UPI0039E51023
MLKRLVILFPLIVVVSACTPRVELAMPSEPITINLNVKIDHQIRVKVDQQLDDIFNDESGLF